jgi:ribA/ribD-fused uncharacterized protein
METDKEIYFYGINDEFGYMSNFYKTTFKDENEIQFNCSEQYFMYHKCMTFEPLNEKLLNEILNETSATKIKKYGRMIKNFDENVWNEKKYHIMVDALRLKFDQNENIKKKLLETNYKILYEASATDKIWGIGFSCENAINENKIKFGQNLLGKALMQIRYEILK